MKITSRMPRHEYDAIDALNISRLKEMKRSPLHFHHLLTNPKRSAPLTLGTATHVAVLEPERYASEFTTWDRMTAGGKSAPRTGQYWEAFVATAGKKTILTPDQNALANAIAAAVRFHPTANKYLETGDPEVTLEWNLPPELGYDDGTERKIRKAKGRLDWFTIVDGRPCLVGLKTTRDCRHFQFSRQAANLGYHLNWAYYHDAFTAIKGTEPRSVEIVVEVAPPHAVKVYNIPNELILQGRDEYWECVKHMNDCARSGEWPGPGGDDEEDLSLPSWAYQQEETLEGLDLVE